MKRLIMIAVVAMLFTAGARPYRRYTRAEQDVDRQMDYIWSCCVKRGIPDWDENGITNCCDKAVSFIREWRRVYSREIRLCQQTTLQLNHMYVQVKMDWGWWSVDPAWSYDGTHDMQKVWGNQYRDGADMSDAYWVRYFSRWL